MGQFLKPNDFNQSFRKQSLLSSFLINNTSPKENRHTAPESPDPILVRKEINQGGMKKQWCENVTK